MSDATLRDQALVELKKTKVGYTKLKVKPPVDKQSAWYKGLTPLQQISGADAATAVAELQQTGVSYEEWQRRVQAGVYTPTDGSTTHWGKALAAMARIGGSTTAFGDKLRAAFPPFPPPQTIVQDKTFTTRQYKSGNDLLWRNVEVTGPESHAFEAAGGNDRVTYELCRVHDLLRDNPGQPDGDHNSCEGYSMHQGPGQVRILGGETWNIGTSRFSHAVYAGSVAKLLVAGHLAHDVGDYVYQLYPGEGKNCSAVITNNTFGWPLSTSGVALVVWAESGSWTCDVYNSIIWGDVQTQGNATLRLHNCVIPPQFSVDAVLDNCLRIDPGFTGHYVPTDPRVLTGADPGWVPSFDYSGKPYSRATIGAVAA